MQWLIDIVKAWIEAQNYATEAWVEAKGYLTTAYVDRGDPATYDWQSGDFTKDNVWRDLDLSAIVPAGAITVALSCHIQATEVAKRVQFRKKGNVNTRNVAEMWTQVSAADHAGDLIVALDADKKIQYRIHAATWLSLNVTVKGWWL